MVFQTENGLVIPAVTAEQMREIDFIAMEDLSLGILQMMENAGRNLAQNVMDMLGADEPGRGSEIAVLAGAGGNGGGGICCARPARRAGTESRCRAFGANQRGWDRVQVDRIPVGPPGQILACLR